MVLRMAWVCCVLAMALAVQADVKLPAILGSNMVLQRDREVPVWGKAEPGEVVTVEFAGKKETATANANGFWRLKINTPSKGGPFEMTVSGKNTITLTNILVGEVWVASGQSNMEWSVKSSNNPEQEIKDAKYPSIRLFTVKKKIAETPVDDCEGSWSECTPESVPGFSAVAYFFGRELHQTLNVPVGLINTSWGGTPAESWTSKGGLEANPELQSLFTNWNKKAEDYPKAKENYEKNLKKWEADAAAAKTAGKPAPQKPRGPNEPSKDPHRPTVLFNGMINPIVPFAIRGAIWYQGESNAGRAHQYRTLFPAMIEDWRAHWGQGEFPFLWVQLANFMARKQEPADSAWAELREAQQMTLSLKNTGTGLSIDIGEEKDIHPRNKQDVGKRLALGALKIAYSKDVVYSGPLYKSMKQDGCNIRLKFDHVGGGLTAKGEKLTGFAIAGEDKKFVWANAEIDGKEVVVSSASVPVPVAVRYGWADNPEVSLYNKEGLPASPFRTDSWDGVTKGK